MILIIFREFMETNSLIKPAWTLNFGTNATRTRGPECRNFDFVETGITGQRDLLFGLYSGTIY
jgi:hypothetical protein